MADCRGRAGAGRRGTPNFLLFLNTFRTGSSVGTGAQALNCCHHRRRDASELRGAAGSVRGTPSQLGRALPPTLDGGADLLVKTLTRGHGSAGRRNSGKDVHLQPIL
jgi:hypothetical protein